MSDSLSLHGLCACQDPVSLGFSRQRYWSGVPCPPPRDLPDPGIEPASLRLLHWRRILYPWANREATPCPSASGLFFGFPSRLGHHRALSKVPCLIQLVFFSDLFHTQCSVQFSCSVFWLFATPWTAAHQASLSTTNSRSLLKLMSIESVMPSNHLIVCHLLFLPSIFPSIMVFSNESVLCIRWANVGVSASAE